MNVLVTGGCGYVGSALLPHLQAAEEVDRLTVLDDLSTGTPRNLFGVDVADEFAFRSGDVRNYGEVENAVRDADAVIHLAAITGAASTHDRPEETRAVNYEGTKNVLTAAEKFGIGNVVFASSCNSYGRAATEDIDESVEPAPINPYAETKHDSESLLREFVSSTGADATALRMSTNYGLAPGIRFNLVVNHFVFRALTGRPLTVYGDGSNWRPFIHVRDAARAFAHAALSPEQWSHLVYNVGSNDENYRIAEVARVVRDEIDADLDVTYLQDEHPGPSYHINFDRLAETGFEPRYTLPRGVRELAEAFSESWRGTLEGEGVIEP